MITTLWLLAALVPLLAAAVLGATHRALSSRSEAVTATLVQWAPAALVPAGAITLIGPTEPVEAPGLLLGTVLGLDVISRALLLVAVLLYAAACVAVTWRRDDRAPELIAYLLVCFVGNAGVYVAGDIVTFYLCFTLMSFAAVGLVIHDRSEAARRATRVYLVLAVMSESAILVGLLLVAGSGGHLIADVPAVVSDSSSRLVIVVLLIIGFGLKAGLFTLHVWLPLAHPAAPPPASAVLSGAMVKAGLVGWLRFLPLGETAMHTTGMVLLVLSLLGAFIAALIGGVQQDAKVVLAYSTISQMGFVGAAVGVALAHPDLAPACIIASVIYAVHHGLAKGALFVGIPVWKHHGEGARRRLVIAGMVLAGLAVVGSPLSSGAIGKYAVKEAVAGTTLIGIDLVHLLPLVATGSTLLLIRLGWLLRHTDLEPLRPEDDPELPAWLALVVLSATVPWLLTDWWVPLAAVPGLEAVTVWEATWPVLIGLLVGTVLWRIHPGPDRDPDLVPPGDVLVPAERVLATARTRLHRLGSAGSVLEQRVRGLVDGVGRSLLAASRTAQQREASLSAWRPSGLAILVVLAVTIAAVLLGAGRW